MGGYAAFAGDFAGMRGPARTFTPVDRWDIRLEPESKALVN